MQEILDFLKKFAGDGKAITAEDAAQVASLLKSQAGLQPLYQSIYDVGHSDATQRHRPRERDLEKERDKEKERADKAVADLEEFKKTAPEAAKVEEKYKGEITKLEEQVKELRKTHRAERERWHVDQTAKDLAAALVKRGVDPEWAEYLADKAENRQRIKPVADGEMIKIEILKPGSELALQADKPLEAFADELRRGVKATYITAGSDTGSGERKGGSTTSVYDQVREEQKKLNEQAKPEGHKTAAERLALR